MTIKDKIQMRIKRSKRYVFMRDDFKDITDYDQIGRVLRNLVQEEKLLKVGYGIYTQARKNQITGRNLVQEEKLLKVGYGIYTQARKNQITGKIMPACPEGADAVILEALKRLDVQVTLGEATEKYLSGMSTQIPAFTQIKTPRRFTRQLSVGCSHVNV